MTITLCDGCGYDRAVLGIGARPQHWIRLGASYIDGGTTLLYLTLCHDCADKLRSAFAAIRIPWEARLPP